MSAAQSNQTYSIQQLTDVLTSWIAQSTPIAEHANATPTSKAAYESILIAGSASSGKTTVLRRALVEAIRAYGDGQALMCVANRKIADTLIRSVMQSLGASNVTRPVTTLAAFAFQCASQLAAIEQQQPIKLLNGAQQDAVIRTVLVTHIMHVLTGDTCQICAILREYFGTADWVQIINPTANAQHMQLSEAQIKARLAQGLSDSFIDEMRDMFARIGELGIRGENETQVVAEIANADSDARSATYGARFAVQWKLAFVLRAEYEQEVARAYPQETRADATVLIELGTQAVQQLDKQALPKLLIIDDAHDITLAQLRFITALYQRGVRIILSANPDESVQSFRGAFPEFVLSRLTHERESAPTELDHMMYPFAPLIEEELGNIHARAYRLEAPYDEQHARYLDRVLSRVSLSIHSQISNSLALEQRLGKAPVLAGTLPIEANTAWVDDRQSEVYHQRSLRGMVYRTDLEERQALVQTMRAYHAQGQSWNSMAVIAHDNAQVQQLGTFMREQGIPVSFATQSTPLAQDSTVQGLFALIRLALWRTRGLQSAFHNGQSATDRQMLMREVASQVKTFCESQLCVAAADTSSNYMQSLGNQWHAFEQILRMITQVAQVVTPQSEQAQIFTELTDAWQRLASALDYQAEQATRVERLTTATTVVDNAILGDDAANTLSHEEMPYALSIEALLMLVVSQERYAEIIQTLVRTICGSERSDSRLEQVCTRLCTAIERVAHAIQSAPVEAQYQNHHGTAVISPAYLVQAAWVAADVDKFWQQLALQGASDEEVWDDESPASSQYLMRATATQQAADAANQRLDTVIRLFAHAHEVQAGTSIEQFMQQMNTLRLEADSLASHTPQLDAVLLTTPAGSVGVRRDYVWIPTVEQGVWPNLTPRGTLFGIEDLAQRVMYGADVRASYDNPFERVLAAEQRLFVVALSRAAKQVNISAVHNDEQSPSDFLSTYIPEIFDEQTGIAYNLAAQESDNSSDMELGQLQDPRSLVAVARQHSIQQHNAHGGDEQPAQVQDAVQALALLAEQHYDLAHPKTWSFVQDSYTDNSVETITANPETTATNLERTTAGAENTEADTAPQTDTEAQSQTQHQPSTDDRQSQLASLSPSDVNALDACAICWKMSRDFAGPTLSSSQQQQGNIIHAILEHATLIGIDLPDYQHTHYSGTREEQIEQCATELEAIGEQYRNTDMAQQGQEAFEQAVQEEAFHQILTNVATYFIQSNDPEYVINTKLFPKKPSNSPRIGKLDYVLAEQSFDATISVAQLCQVINAQLQSALSLSEYGNEGAQSAVLNLSMEQCLALAQLITPQWQVDARHPIDIAQLRIHLHGSIDRIELRTLDDGSELVRIIDYKTGSNFTKKTMFSDLQLACYQLGIHFGHFLAGEQENKRVALQQVTLQELEQRAKRGVIGQSSLFVIKDSTQPAQANAAESAYQPPLIVTHISDNNFQSRTYTKTIDNIWDVPQLPQSCPELFDERTWQCIHAVKDTQGMWAVSMIAKIIRAAVGSQSQVFTTTEVPEQHLNYCKFTTVCPACAEQVSTVMEELS